MSPLRGIFQSPASEGLAAIIAAAAEASSTSAAPPASTATPATTTPAGLSSFSDDFDGDLSAFTQTRLAGSRDFAVADGLARLQTSAWEHAETRAMLSTPLASADHLARIEEADYPDGPWHTLVVRANTAQGNPDDAYLLKRFHTYFAQPIWTLVRRKGGVESVLASDSPDWLVPTAVWELRVSGTGEAVTLTVKLDGETLAEVVDDSEDRLLDGRCVGWGAGANGVGANLTISITRFHAETL